MYLCSGQEVDHSTGIVLEQCQSAYRMHHSTETALLHVHDDILRTLGSRRAVLFVMLDLSAAFETVDSEILQKELHHLGIQGTAAAWFRSYMSERQQQVIIQDARSDPTELECGVPQGSVLGPILFTLYTASLGRLLRHYGVKFHFYADDTQIWLPFDPEEQDAAMERLEDCLRAVQRWMEHHKLKMNSDKSEYLLIATNPVRRALNHQRSLHIGNQLIQPRTDAVRNLGVQMSPDASVEAHISSLSRTCFMQIANINRIKRYVSQDVLKMLIHCLVTSKLDYSNILLNGAPACQLQRLQKIQNTCARIITGVGKYEHITPILHQLHWLPIEQRIKFKVILTVFKVLNNRAPSYLSDLIQVRQSDHPLRANSNVLNVPFTSSVMVFNRVFSVAGPRLWNSIPDRLRNIESSTDFKTHLKTFLFREHFYPV